MRPRIDHADRSHKTHCLFNKISKRESSIIFSKLKEQKMSITFYAAAATILAVKDLYGSGSERGALLGMTRNGRRWINTTGADGAATIPMATDVVFLWIPFADDATDSSQTLNLASKIRQELAPHLRSPHYMASMQLMCSEYVENLKACLDTEKTVQPSPPGFSPQGKLMLKKHFSSDKPHAKPIERITIHHTGRQVNASPWIGMFSLDDEIHTSIGFDEKYYEPRVIDRFFAQYNKYLLDLSRTPVKPTDELSSNVQARL